LPLTTLNSVVALVYLAKDLFPERKPMSTREVAMSVGLMNLIGCFFGSTPYCHGSGGLAGQYRFGARSGTSVCMLGLIKIIVGLVFGSSLTGLLGSFPQSLLGVMLLISGVELACAARTYCCKEASAAEQRDSFTVVITTAGMLLAFSNDGVGFISGLLCHMLLEFQRRRHLAADDDHTVRPDESATHSNPMSVGTHSSQGEPAASNDAAITSAPSTLPEKNSLSKEPAPATHINVYQESY
jgi:MFS superfamily sulfate permease-like transporter